MKHTVFTVGYSGFSPEEFIAALRSQDISLVADVRSRPYSRYYREFNKEALERTLGREGIRYRSFARELGGMQTDRRYFTEAGYPDFERYARSETFLEGIDRLKNLLNRGERFSLMCAEKDPYGCHRAILIARYFHDAGYPVVHLMPGADAVTQEDIENRLIREYFPGYGQTLLFEERPDRRTCIVLAYRKRNEEMGRFFVP